MILKKGQVLHIAWCGLITYTITSIKYNEAYNGFSVYYISETYGFKPLKLVQTEFQFIEELKVFGLENVKIDGECLTTNED